MLKKLRYSLSDAREEKGKMHGQVGINMGQFREKRLHLDPNAQFLFALTDERLLFGFTCLDLTADEFPKHSARLMRRSAADQKASVFTDQRSDDLCHWLILLLRFPPTSRYADAGGSNG